MTLLSFKEACKAMEMGLPIRQLGNRKAVMWLERNSEGGVWRVAPEGDFNDVRVWLPTEEQLKATDYGIAVNFMDVTGAEEE